MAQLYMDLHENHNLKCLDTNHHQGLRLALGAFRTSPVESLYAESNEPSLYTRREKNYRSNTPRS